MKVEIPKGFVSDFLWALIATPMCMAAALAQDDGKDGSPPNEMAEAPSACNKKTAVAYRVHNMWIV